MSKLEALSNQQIDNALSLYPSYGGCISKDILKLNEAKRNKFYVINLDDDKGPGTHWTCLYNCNKDAIYYFDPFGAPPPERVCKFMRKSGKRGMYYSDIDLQHVKASSCGWYCVYVLLQLLRGKQFIDILLGDFTLDTSKNEELLRKYFIY